MNISQFFESVFAAIKSGLAVQTIPPLITFFENTGKLDLLSVSGQIAYAAQVDLLRSTVTANVTGAAPAELQSINQTFSNEMQVALQAALAKETATAAKPAT
jgi:hypothetical protein